MPSGFSYNAYAMALGGAITSTNETIPSVGSIVLSPSGGTGSAQIGPYSSPLGSVTASAIQTTVRGGQLSESTFEAESTVTITNLTVRDIQRGVDIFHANFLYGRVYSVHEIGGTINPESSITFQAQISGLMAADETVDASLDTTLCNAGDTFDRFVSAFASRSDAAALASHYGWTLASGSPVVPQAFRDAGTIPVTVMSRTAVSSLAAPRNRFTITIPGQGELHIGEAILKRGRRRLSLLRLELGAGEVIDLDSPVGSLSFACLEGNGTEILP